MFVGLVLGVMAALGLELINRRVRSEADLVEGIGLPVLGTISHPAAQKGRDRRLGFGREPGAAPV